MNSLKETSLHYLQNLKDAITRRD